MNAGKIIKIIFYSLIALLVFRSGQIAYNKINAIDDSNACKIHKFQLDFKEITIPENTNQKNGPCGDIYNFSKMLNLIETCEKVKYLDYVSFSRPKEATRINPETLDALLKALHEEKSNLKRYIRRIKSEAKSSVPTKKMKALKYYLRVVELNLQDLKSLESEK